MLQQTKMPVVAKRCKVEGFQQIKNPVVAKIHTGSSKKYKTTLVSAKTKNADGSRNLCGFQHLAAMVVALASIMRGSSFSGPRLQLRLATVPASLQVGCSIPTPPLSRWCMSSHGALQIAASGEAGFSSGHGWLQHHRCRLQTAASASSRCSPSSPPTKSIRRRTNSHISATFAAPPCLPVCHTTREQRERR